MTVLSTYYKLSLASLEGNIDSKFTTTIHQHDPMDQVPATDRELVDYVRNLWRQRCNSQLDELLIQPVLKFEVTDGDSTVDYALSYYQPTSRSQTREVQLLQGLKHIGRWKEPVSQL